MTFLLVLSVLFFTISIVTCHAHLWRTSTITTTSWHGVTKGMTVEVDGQKFRVVKVGGTVLTVRKKWWLYE